jgi:membrane-associated phospholipid phosphatase
VSRRPSFALLLAGAYAALAALFAAGAFRRVDQWAVDHLMPGSHFRRGEPGVVDSIVPLLHSRWDNGYAIAANLVTLPAALLISVVLATLLSRRLAIALVAAVAVEVLCKTVVDGPALFHGTSHIVAFDSSFPSGHTLRTVILAGGVALCRPQLRLLACAWAVAAIVLLELAGWHTPSDVAGGVVLGALALLGGRAAGALGGRRLAARA